MSDEQPTSLLEEFRAEAAAEAAAAQGEIVWEGADVLRQHLVPIESLQDHEANPRKGDVAAIAASLREFGQVRAILYDSNTNTIIAGHHVRYAARELGWTHVAAISNAFVDKHQALAYLLVDNRLTTVGEMDSRKEYAGTLELEKVGYGEVLNQTGYDIDYRETLMDEAGLTPATPARDWEGEAGESPEAAAARAAAIAQYEQHREVVLLLSFPEQYETFAKDVRLLMAEYGTTGTVATIVRAVAEAARLTEQKESESAVSTETDLPSAGTKRADLPEPTPSTQEPGDDVA